MTTTAIYPPAPDAFRRELDAWHLARYGGPVHWTSEWLPLAGHDALWLVADGYLDFFAVGGHGRGVARFLGRLGAGTLVPASAPGPEHVLAGRALPGCAVRRIAVAELLAEPRPVDRALFGSRRADEALVRGVDAGIGPLLSAVDAAPPAGTPTLIPGYRVELRPGDAVRPVHGIVWLRVLSGQVGELGTGATAAVDDAVTSETGAVVAVGTTGDLLADGVLWRYLAAEELRLRYALDRRINGRAPAARRAR